MPNWDFVTPEGEAVLEDFQKRSASSDKILLYRLGDRGFLAEVTYMGLVMIYSLNHNFRLVIDCEKFNHRYQDGWSDYFVSPFETYDPTIHTSIDALADFGDSGELDKKEKPGFQLAVEILNQDVNDLVIADQHYIHRVDMMTTLVSAIFRPNEYVQAEIERAHQKLRLADDYLCAHIRRGDKVGDEDIHYDVSEYFAHLSELDEVQDLFVMSDDYGAIEEVVQWLQLHGKRNRLVSLCTPGHTGFDIWQLRRRENFFQHGRDGVATERSFEEFLFNETVQLIAEVAIASRSRHFVGTGRSNIFRTVNFVRGRQNTSGLMGEMN